MKQKRFSDEQIIGILKEADVGTVVLDLCRKHGMSSATFYAWKAKYGGLELSEAKRLRARGHRKHDCEQQDDEGKVAH
jgi:putative transposase